MYLVHAATPGRALRYERSFDVTLLDTLKGSSTNNVRNKVRNREQMVAMQSDVQEGLRLLAFEQSVSPELRRWTDLWGTFQVMSDANAARVGSKRRLLLQRHA
jgi:hypothetical protein